MNTKEVAQQIIKTAKAKGADFCEVVVSQNEFSLKRIKQGQVDQPPAREQWEIDLAIVKNNHKRAITFDNPLFAGRIIEKTMQQIALLPRQETVVSFYFRQGERATYIFGKHLCGRQRRR
jgi:hypothetical protein